MTRDIADLLAGAVEERAEALVGLRPTPAAFALTRVRIRRRRTVRHSVEAGVGVAASGVVAAGVWFGMQLDRSPAPPVDTPTVAPTPGPTTPAPTPTPTPSPTATERPAPALPGQPSALLPPDDLLAHTGAGWVLAIYRSDPPDADPTTVTSQALYAIAPDGTRYRLATTTDNVVLRLLDWQAGDGRARVAFGPPASEFVGVGWLDLRTGAMTPEAIDVPDDPLFVGRLDDGTELWQTAQASPVRLYATTPGSPARLVGELGDSTMPVLVSAPETRVATLATDTRRLIALDLATGERRTVDLGDGQMCTLLAWLDDASVLVQCFDPTGGERVVDWHPHLSTVNVDTGVVAEVESLGVGEPFVPVYSSGINLDHWTVAFPAYTLDDQVPTADVCTNGVWRWTPDGLRQLWAFGGSSDGMTLDTAGGSVFIEARPGCLSGLESDELVAVAADGAVRVVAPAPDAVDGVAWLTDLSWTPAG